MPALQVVPLDPFFIRSGWLRYDWTASLSPDNIATVACQQLGLPLPGKAVLDATYGIGKGPIFLARLVCTGTEPGVEFCSYEFNQETSSTLLHTEDLGIECGPQ